MLRFAYACVTEETDMDPTLKDRKTHRTEYSTSARLSEGLEERAASVQRFGDLSATKKWRVQILRLMCLSWHL